MTGADVWLAVLILAVLAGGWGIYRSLAAEIEDDVRARARLIAEATRLERERAGR